MAKASVGKITQVIGAVVDVQLDGQPAGNPQRSEQQTTTATRLVLEVAQHLG